MNNLAYSGVNTTVRILEDQLLTKDDFETLLKSSSLKEALEYLQKTSYEIDVPDALENKNFEHTGTHGEDDISFLCNGL